jgi:hypothetical protein
VSDAAIEVPMKAIVQPARWVNATYVRIRVDGVDKVADDRVEARIGALGTSISFFLTLRLKRPRSMDRGYFLSRKQ